MRILILLLPFFLLMQPSFGAKTNCDRDLASSFAQYKDLPILTREQQRGLIYKIYNAKPYFIWLLLSTQAGQKELESRLKHERSVIAKNPKTKTIGQHPILIPLYEELLKILNSQSKKRDKRLLIFLKKKPAYAHQIYNISKFRQLAHKLLTQAQNTHTTGQFNESVFSKIDITHTVKILFKANSKPYKAFLDFNDAIDKLLKHNIRFIFHTMNIAASYYTKFHHLVSEAEIEGEAVSGYLNGLKKFDPESYSGCVTTYTRGWIIQSVQRLFKPFIKRENRPLSLDATYRKYSTSDDSASLADFLSNKGEENLQKTLFNQEMYTHLLEILFDTTIFTAQEKQVIDLYFGLSSQHSYSMPEIAPIMKVSRSRIGQIYTSAMKKFIEIFSKNRASDFIWDEED